VSYALERRREQVALRTAARLVADDLAFARGKMRAAIEAGTWWPLDDPLSIETWAKHRDTLTGHIGTETWFDVIAAPRPPPRGWPAPRSALGLSSSVPARSPRRLLVVAEQLVERLLPLAIRDRAVAERAQHLVVLARAAPSADVAVEDLFGAGRADAALAWQAEPVEHRHAETAARAFRVAQLPLDRADGQRGERRLSGGVPLAGDRSR
jgi:hypothetical protein